MRELKLKVKQHAGGSPTPLCLDLDAKDAVRVPSGRRISVRARNWAALASTLDYLKVRRMIRSPIPFKHND